MWHYKSDLHRLLRLRNILKCILDSGLISLNNTHSFQEHSCQTWFIFSLRSWADAWQIKMGVSVCVKLSQDKGNIKSEIKATLSYLMNNSFLSIKWNDICESTLYNHKSLQKANYSCALPYKVLSTLSLGNKDFQFNIKAWYASCAMTVNRISSRK